MGREALTEGQCAELYELWEDMYRTSGDRAGAHLRWLGVDPGRLEEVADYVERRPVDKLPGLPEKTAVFCQSMDVVMLRYFAKEIREEQE